MLFQDSFTIQNVDLAILEASDSEQLDTLSNSISSKIKTPSELFIKNSVKPRPELRIILFNVVKDIQIILLRI